MDLFHNQIVELISVAGLPLIIQLSIGVGAFTKMRQSQTAPLKYLFVASFVLMILCTISVAIRLMLLSKEDVVYDEAYWESVSPPLFAFNFLFICLYSLAFLSLLATFVIRLHVTFRDSNLKMYEITVYRFIILFVSLFTLCILVAVGIILERIGHNTIGRTISDYSWISFLFLYIIGSLSSVRMFVVKLSAIHLSVNVQDKSLLHLAAKFILLFFVSVSSTLLNLIPLLYHHAISYFAPFDLCINLFCLYLQFSCAEKHYQKCCGALHRCCVCVVSSKANSSIQQEPVIEPEAQMSTATITLDTDDVLDIEK